MQLPVHTVPAILRLPNNISAKLLAARIVRDWCKSHGRQFSQGINLGFLLNPNTSDQQPISKNTQRKSLILMSQCDVQIASPPNSPQTPRDSD